MKDRQFCKDFAMKRSSKKNYIHIDHETGSNEQFSVLDKIESETQSEIVNLLEFSDKEYIAEEPILDNEEQGHQLLTSEATIYFKGEVLDIHEEAATKLENQSH